MQTICHVSSTGILTYSELGPVGVDFRDTIPDTRFRSAVDNLFRQHKPRMIAVTPCDRVSEEVWLACDARQSVSGLYVVRQYHLTRPFELSDREVEVALLLGESASKEEIAHRLHIGKSTVARHIENFRGKLDLPNLRTLATHCGRNYHGYEVLARVRGLREEALPDHRPRQSRRTVGEYQTATGGGR